MRGHAVAAFLVGAIAVLALAAPAAAEHRKPRLGVTAGQVTAADFDSMAKAGVKSLRVILSWAAIETTRGYGDCARARYRWDYADFLVRSASRHGIHLLPVILGSPEYAAPSRTNAPHTRTKAFRDYGCFVRALVDRYGRGGSFVGASGVRAVKRWQVWNEPNLRNYAAKRRINPWEYGRLLKRTERHIHRADPRATIVLAGMPEFLGRGKRSIHVYLKRLYRVKGIKRRFDVAAIHPYAADHRGVKGALIRTRRTLRKVGDRRRALWITETGYASSGPKWHFIVSSERGQAKRLRYTLKMLQRNRKRFKLGTIDVFKWRDQALPSERTGVWQDYAGLFRKGGQAKPACRAFVRFTWNGRCTDIGG